MKDSVRLLSNISVRARFPLEAARVQKYPDPNNGQVIDGTAASIRPPVPSSPPFCRIHASNGAVFPPNFTS